MNASKENCRKALDELDMIALGCANDNPSVLFLKEFLLKCEKRLSSEASLVREKERSKSHRPRKVREESDTTKTLISGDGPLPHLEMS